MVNEREWVSVIKANNQWKAKYWMYIEILQSMVQYIFNIYIEYTMNTLSTLNTLNTLTLWKNWTHWHSEHIDTLNTLPLSTHWTLSERIRHELKTFIIFSLWRKICLSITGTFALYNTFISKSLQSLYQQRLYLL